MAVRGGTRKLLSLVKSILQTIVESVRLFG